MSARSIIRVVADVGLKRIAAGAALSAALAGGGLYGPDLVQHLKQEEALGDGKGRLVYIDPVGVRTWCYGDTGPVPNTPLNAEVCSAQLDKKVREICVPVAKAIKVPVYVHEMAAICSWAYNVGTSAAIRSSAIRELNNGNYAQVPNLLLDWKFARGRDCSIRTSGCYGLWKRRLTEADMFRGVY